ncbi:hypothetical protein EJ02DRAFT_462930 [Clathrospora elynae]|uniref:Uncharacterized protein n=1 Tax=Clathrospora elynae TaxID=706981 RepID=A0A6A5T2P8_9PLEO|nr:hypothetical protein EJ02DRAFT_462930 [Clathrospora elynae]
MEQTEPELRQRSISFNPEAATFSPTTPNAAVPTGSAGSTPLASPHELSKLPGIFDQNSPFRLANSKRPIYHDPREAKVGRVPRGLPYQSDIPLDALQNMLKGHHIALAQGRPSTEFQDAPPITTSDSSMPHYQPFIFSRPEPNFSAVDVDELSASFGLPGMKKVTADQSPARSHKSRTSRTSQGPSEGLFGKLIGRALDKPLTANALAQYLHGDKNVSSDGTVTAPHGALRGFQDDYSGILPSEDREDVQTMKIVGPPPGFSGVTPRMIPAEERISVTPAIMDPQYVPTGPAAYGHARRRSNLQSFNPAQHNARHPFDRRRPRAYTRVKRTDQGPEPSHADIYPDDANWMSSRRPYRSESLGTFHQTYMPQRPPQQEFHVEDIVSWPTPAEGYIQKPDSPPPQDMFKNDAPFGGIYVPEGYQASTFSTGHMYEQYAAQTRMYTFKPATPPSPLNIFKNHEFPTEEDLNEADDEVVAIVDELPMQLDSISSDLRCDERSLTPDQLTGTRYGMRYYGIALGDSWQCPGIQEVNPFRVRPRDHEGWGGWEWALKSGWGDE